MAQVRKCSLKEAANRGCLHRSQSWSCCRFVCKPICYASLNLFQCDKVCWHHCKNFVLENLVFRKFIALFMSTYRHFHKTTLETVLRLMKAKNFGVTWSRTILQSPSAPSSKLWRPNCGNRLANGTDCKECFKFSKKNNLKMKQTDAAVTNKMRKKINFPGIFLFIRTEERSETDVSFTSTFCDFIFLSHRIK